MSTGYTPFRLMFAREPITRMPDVNVNQTEDTRAEEIARRNDEVLKARSM